MPPAPEYWSEVLKALQRLHHEMAEQRPTVEAMLRKAYAYTGHDMQRQGRAARALGRDEVMQHIRGRADEWRNGASSVKGHHLPLKHVYRWLDELEGKPMRDIPVPEIATVEGTD